MDVSIQAKRLKLCTLYNIFLLVRYYHYLNAGILFEEQIGVSSEEQIQ